MGTHDPGGSDLRFVQLGQALARLDPDAGWEDLRDILWLAPMLPAGRSVDAIGATPPASGDAPVSADAQDKAQGSPRPMAAEDNDPRPQKAVQIAAVDDTEEPAAVYAGPGATAGGVGAGGLRPIRLPSPDPLPDGAALARALRPLGRRRWRGPARVLDEAATAESIAETGLPRPVLRPERQRWFDAVVAVDASITLLAWRPRVDKFVGLLRRRAGLRNVYLSSLHGGDGGVLLRAPDGRLMNEASWIHGRGDRLLLIVTDSSGPAWHDGTMARWLHPWSQQMPIATAQLLPPSLWSHTGLGFANLRVQARRPGASNATLQVQRPAWAEGEPGLVLPVFALDEDGARQWSRMLMAAGNARCAAALLPYEAALPVPRKARAGAVDAAETDPTLPSGDQAALLSALRRSARPQALKLASALAAIKPLTLPVVRLVHATLASQAEQAPQLEDLAQVLASGLLMPRLALAPHAAFDSGPDDLVLLDMADPVREQLVGGLTRSEWMHLNLAVQRYVEDASGSPFDFMAYLEDRKGSSQLAPAALPFARFARQLADRFRPPGSRRGSPGMRLVNEDVAGLGLTFQAQRRLPGDAQSLRWSADGSRLGVLHRLGLDLHDGSQLRTGPRSRQGGWTLFVCCHAADIDPVRELMGTVTRELELRMQRPIELRMQAIPGDAPEDWHSPVLENMMVNAGTADWIGSQSVPVFALTGSLKPQVPYPVWLKRAAQGLEIPCLALAANWAGVDRRSDLWLDALLRGVSAGERMEALDDFQRQLEARFGPLKETSEIEAFDFADPSGGQWVVAHRHRGVPALFRLRIDEHGNEKVSNMQYPQSEPVEAAATHAVVQLHVLDGSTLALQDNRELLTWWLGEARGRPSTSACRALTVTSNAVLMLQADEGISVQPRSGAASQAP